MRLLAGYIDRVSRACVCGTDLSSDHNSILLLQSTSSSSYYTATSGSSSYDASDVTGPMAPPEASVWFSHDEDDEEEQVEFDVNDTPREVVVFAAKDSVPTVSENYAKLTVKHIGSDEFVPFDESSKEAQGTVAKSAVAAILEAIDEHSTHDEQADDDTTDQNDDTAASSSEEDQNNDVEENQCIQTRKYAANEAIIKIADEMLEQGMISPDGDMSEVSEVSESTTMDDSGHNVKPSPQSPPSQTNRQPTTSTLTLPTWSPTAGKHVASISYLDDEPVPSDEEPSIRQPAPVVLLTPMHFQATEMAATCSNDVVASMSVVDSNGGERTPAIVSSVLSEEEPGYIPSPIGVRKMKQERPALSQQEPTLLQSVNGAIAVEKSKTIEPETHEGTWKSVRSQPDDIDEMHKASNFDSSLDEAKSFSADQKAIITSPDEELLEDTFASLEQSRGAPEQISGLNEMKEQAVHTMDLLEHSAMSAKVCQKSVSKHEEDADDTLSSEEQTDAPDECALASSQIEANDAAPSSTHHSDTDQDLCVDKQTTEVDSLSEDAATSSQPEGEMDSSDSTSQSMQDVNCSPRALLPCSRNDSVEDAGASSCQDSDDCSPDSDDSHSQSTNDESRSGRSESGCSQSGSGSSNAESEEACICDSSSSQMGKRASVDDDVEAIPTSTTDVSASVGVEVSSECATEVEEQGSRNDRLQPVGSNKSKSEDLIDHKHASSGPDHCEGGIDNFGSMDEILGSSGNSNLEAQHEPEQAEPENDDDEEDEEEEAPGYEVEYDPVAGRRGAESPLSFVSDLSFSDSMSIGQTPVPELTMFHVFGASPMAVTPTAPTRRKHVQMTPPTSQQRTVATAVNPEARPTPTIGSPSGKSSAIQSIFGWLQG